MALRIPARRVRTHLPVVLAVLLGLSCASDRSVCPRRTTSEELYYNFRSLLEGALSECCATLRYAIDARVAVDTSFVPGLRWPVFVPDTEADWAEFESGTWTMFANVNGDHRFADKRCSFYRRDVSNDLMERDATDTAASVICERRFNVRIIEDGRRSDWTVRIEAGYTMFQVGQYALELGVSAYRHTGYSNPDYYGLEISGSLGNPNLTDLPITPGGHLSGQFIETQTSARSGDGVQIMWLLEGHFVSNGALEIETTSGDFFITDTLSLCP